MKALKIKRDPATIERMRRNKSRLSVEQIREIQLDGGTRLADLAARYGLSANYICTIRSGWKSHSIPNSVFNWRPKEAA